MSNKKEQEKLEEVAIINEAPQEETIRGEVTFENKNEKTMNVLKKVGKISAVVGIGFLGYLFGYKCGKKATDDYVDEYDEIIDNNETTNENN